MSTAAAAVNPVSAMADKYSGMDFVNLLSSLAKQVSGEFFLLFDSPYSDRLIGGLFAHI